MFKDCHVLFKSFCFSENISFFGPFSQRNNNSEMRSFTDPLLGKI